MKKGIGKTAMSLLLAAAMTVSMPSAGGTILAASGGAVPGEALGSGSVDTDKSGGVFLEESAGSGGQGSSSGEAESLENAPVDREEADGSPADEEGIDAAFGKDGTEENPVDGESTDKTVPDGSDGVPAAGSDSIPEDAGNQAGESADGENADSAPGEEDADGSPADGESTEGTPGEEDTDGDPVGGENTDKTVPDGSEDGAAADGMLSGELSGDSAPEDTMSLERMPDRDTDGMGVTYETIGDYKHNIYANGQPLLIVASDTLGYAKLYVDSNGNGIGEPKEEITSFQGNGALAGGTGIYYSEQYGGYFLRNSYIYGGARDGEHRYDTYVTLTGPSDMPDSANSAYTVWAIYGGNKEGTLIGDTHVAVSSGSTWIIYGGNEGGTLTGSTDVAVSGGSVSYVYGGNRDGALIGDTHVAISGGNIKSLYGGSSEGTLTGSTDVKVSDGSVSYICGGNWGGALAGDTHVAISGGNANYVWGGGYSGSVDGNTAISVTGGCVANDIYGGLASGSISGNTSISIGSAQVTSVYGGNEASGIVSGNTELVFGDGAVVNGWTYGGGAGKDDNTRTEVAGSTNITINGGCFLNHVYGGGAWRGAKVGSSNITINGGDLTKWVYGGGAEASEVTGTATIAIQGGTVRSVCATGAGFNNTQATVGAADIRLSGGTVNQFSALPNEYASILGDLSVTVSGDSFADTWLYLGLSDTETKGLRTVSVTLKDGKAAGLRIAAKVEEKLAITLENASVGDLWLKAGVLADAQQATLSYIGCGRQEGEWGVHIGGGYPGAASSFEIKDNPLLRGSHLNKNKFTCMTFQNSYVNYFDDSVDGDDNGPATCTKELVLDGGALRVIGDMLTYMPPTKLLNDPLLIRTSAYREGIHFREDPEGYARIQWMNTDGTGITEAVETFALAETSGDVPEDIFRPATDGYAVVYEMAERRDADGNLLWQGRSWKTDLTEKYCRCQVMSSSLKETIFPLPESGGGATVALEDARKEDTSVSQDCPIFTHKGKAAVFTYTLLGDGTTAPGAALEGDSLKVDGTGAVHVEVGQNLNGKTFTYDAFVYFIRAPEKERYTFAQGMAEDISLSFEGVEFNRAYSYIYNTSQGSGHGYVDHDKYTMTLENGVLCFGFSKDYYNTLPIGEYSFHVGVSFQPQPENASGRWYTYELAIEIVLPTEVENPDIQLSESRFHYDGTAKEPAVVVKDGDTVIPPEEYSVTYQDNVSVGTASVIIANKPGGLYIVGNGSRTFDIVNEYRPEKGQDYLAALDENGWTKDDFVVSAGEGRLLSLGNTVTDDWVDELRRTEETGQGSLTFYVKDQQTGRISLAATESYKIDRTAPEAFDVRFNGTSVKWLPADASFGLFSREEINVSLMAEDALSGLGSIAYHQSGNILTQDQLQEVKDWMAGDRFTIVPGDGRQIIVYARATDLAGNAVYYASQGVEFDLTLPVVGGVKPGGTYYTTQTADVADRNLGSVTLNGEAVSGSLTLPGNREATYVIRATDLAGNETIVTVSMKPISALAQAIEDLTEGNATSDDRAVLESVRAVEADSAGATQEEKEELQEILDICDRLLTRIDTAQGGLADVADAVEGISRDTVQLTDQETLEKAMEELKSLLEEYGGNYTEAEKQAIEEERERIAGALESIGKVLETVKTIEKLPEPEDVSPDDLDTESAAMQAKQALESLTEHERSLVDAEKLEKVLAALTDYRILEGDGSQWIQETERGIAFRVNGAVEKFTGLLVDGEPVDGKHYTVKSGSTIVTLKENYLDTLSVGSHSLTFLYLDGETSGDFQVQAKDGPDRPDGPAETAPPSGPDRPDDSGGPSAPKSQGDSAMTGIPSSPQTGDDMPLFAAIACISGALLAVMALCHLLRLKKRKDTL